MNSANTPNHQQRNLNNCGTHSLADDVNIDRSPSYCEKDLTDVDNKRAINDESLNFLKDETMKKTGFGARVDCDPMQRGQIINDPEIPERTVLYRYSKSIRGTDEAMLDMFRNIVVIDEDGKAWPIPVMLGPPEKAVAVIVQDNVHKDETLVVDRIKLPFLALTQTSIDYDLARYTYHKAINLFRQNGKPGLTINEKYNRDTVFGLARGVPINIGYTVTAWTMYREDMNQILEQILTKFSNAAYIRVTGVPWEVIVKLDSIANNINIEPGDQAIRIIKYEFNMTAQTYIPQPIERKKAVLKMKVDFVDGMTEEQITEVMARLEESVKELEC
jgi:T4-like virus Myoviridae tail sheath stabiliser